SGPANGVLAQGVITAEDVVGALAGDLDALIQAIKDGMIYVNVHTEGIPSGELRGQL
ncbi:MAG: CHRD domain-containing protein, partial [Flavobacteriaceae bacterium]|nr:CHRD domain-containing protein [Flavobacteriaceae bacterium]